MKGPALLINSSCSLEDIFYFCNSVFEKRFSFKVESIKSLVLLFLMIKEKFHGQV